MSTAGCEPPPPKAEKKSTFMIFVFLDLGPDLTVIEWVCFYPAPWQQVGGGLEGWRKACAHSFELSPPTPDDFLISASDISVLLLRAES